MKRKNIKNIYFNMVSAGLIGLIFLISGCTGNAGTENQVNDVTTPLHAMQPDYPVPYGKPEIKEITETLQKIYNYLEKVTPAEIVDTETGIRITDYTQVSEKSQFAKGDFRLTSYEWGVTYAGMLLASEVTGDKRFRDYTFNRLGFIGELASYFSALHDKDPEASSPLRSVLNPKALDDSGSLCAAMIKALMAGGNEKLRPLIDNFINYISTEEFRLPDGTLARNRPQPNTIWLDDLFMSVPALGWMGKLTGEQKYFDDAVKQVMQYSERMFNSENGLYMHGWVEDMEIHPSYHWARANGWAVMTMVELLEVLPPDHPGYQGVLNQLREHINGLASFQDGSGFWHQLIDRSDTYLETSATAIYAFAIARSINKGYIDKRAFAPVAILAWNAVSTKINAGGQVEGTCVGTGMAFDPAFYYHRPVNSFAAHGYGPVMLAGSEIISLLENFDFEINDSSLQLKIAN
jgi:rhamnogalacturonyl hydrolase YesR